MLRFIVLLPIRILLLPVMLGLKLLFWLCCGVLCMTEWVFSLAGSLMLVVAVFTMATESFREGIPLVLLAWAISPFGLPMLAMKLTCWIGCLGDWIQVNVY